MFNGKPPVTVMHIVRKKSASFLQVASPFTEGDQRDRQLGRGSRAVEADELSHFRWLMTGSQHRRLTGAGDDDVSDPAQVVRMHGPEQPGRDRGGAAVHLGPPVQ